MTYATLMVHVEPGRSNAALLHVAADLADRFHAGVIGIASCQPVQVIYGDGYVPDDLIERDRVEIEREMNAAEAEFQRFMQPRVARLDWRSTMAFAPLSDYLSREARCADLFITGGPPAASSTGPDREIQLISSCRATGVDRSGHRWGTKF